MKNHSLSGQRWSINVNRGPSPAQPGGQRWGSSPLSPMLATPLTGCEKGQYVVMLNFYKIGDTQTINGQTPVTPWPQISSCTDSEICVVASDHEFPTVGQPIIISALPAQIRYARTQYISKSRFRLYARTCTRAALEDGGDETLMVRQSDGC